MLQLRSLDLIFDNLSLLHYHLIVYSLLFLKKCLELNPHNVSAGKALSDIYRQTNRLQVDTVLQI